MEYSIGELVYYNREIDDFICEILDKAMGYSWACLTGEPDEPNPFTPERMWYYHIRPIDNPNLFFDGTNMCSQQFILPYRILKPKTTKIKKHRLI